MFTNTDSISELLSNVSDVILPNGNNATLELLIPTLILPSKFNLIMSILQKALLLDSPV
jgi:hypothetical protein